MESKKIFLKYMSRNPFVSSLVLFFLCSLSLYLVYVFLAFAAAPLLDMGGVSVSGVGVPAGGIIIWGYIAAATGLCDVYYAIKAESRLGYLIWFLGIPLFWGLFSVTPENCLLWGDPLHRAMEMYFYRLLLFSLVRAYSYLARDEKRKKAAAKAEAPETNIEQSNGDTVKEGVV